MTLLAIFSNLAGPDLIIILLIILVLFGSKKLPELARGIGQAMKEFHKAKEDLAGEADTTAQESEVHILSPAVFGDAQPTPAAPLAAASPNETLSVRPRGGGAS